SAESESFFAVTIPPTRARDGAPQWAGWIVWERHPRREPDSHSFAGGGARRYTRYRRLSPACFAGGGGDEGAAYPPATPWERRAPACGARRSPPGAARETTPRQSGRGSDPARTPRGPGAPPADRSAPARSRWAGPPASRRSWSAAWVCGCPDSHAGRRRRPPVPNPRTGRVQHRTAGWKTAREQPGRGCRYAAAARPAGAGRWPTPWHRTGPRQCPPWRKTGP